MEASEQKPTVCLSENVGPCTMIKKTSEALLKHESGKKCVHSYFEEAFSSESFEHLVGVTMKYANITLERRCDGQ